MKKLLLLSIFFVLQCLNTVYSQNIKINNPCDCLEIVIKNHELIKEGFSNHDANKILENQNSKCVEMKKKLGVNFEKEILLCENFTAFSKIINQDNSVINTSIEICNCVNSSIKILKEIKKTGNESKSIEKYRAEAEKCELLRQDFENEEYAKLMMNCTNYNKLMSLIIDLRK